MKSCSAYKKHLCNATHYQQQLIQYVQKTPAGVKGETIMGL